MTDSIFVLGRDAVGAVAEDRSMTPPFRYYLTDCCGASSKGMESYVGCRSCYREVDPSLGDVPDKDVRWTQADGITITDKPLALVEVYGDGLTYDDWKARARRDAIAEHVEGLRAGATS